MDCPDDRHLILVNGGARSDHFIDRLQREAPESSVFCIDLLAIYYNVVKMLLSSSDAQAG